MTNPFEIKSAELMDPQEVAREFVQDHTEHAKLASYCHTIVWGSRGSGKSMHFRFLEPMAQAWARDSQFERNVEEFIRSPNSFIAVYVNCRNGVLNRQELRSLENLPNVSPHAISQLLSKYLTCVVLSKMAHTILSQMSWASSIPAVLTSAPLFVQRQFTTGETQLGEVLAKLKADCAIWLALLDRNIAEYYTNMSNPPALPPTIVDMPGLTTELPNTLEWILAVLHVKCPFFLLLDEANELSLVHQKCVNTLFGLRSQRVLCVKAASQKNGFNVGYTLDGQVDETHDFTTLDLDGLYTNNREAYYKRLEHIGNDRLRRCGINVDITEFLPPNPSEVQALLDARKRAEDRYDALEPATRPEDKGNFVKKYAPAILFQEVLSAKSSYTYAGFDNLVHLSSGIVRSFLDCCSRMFDSFVQTHPNEIPSSIPVAIQKDEIAGYSNDFIGSQILSKLSGAPPGSVEAKTYTALHNLLIGLGTLFHTRLLDKTSREPRIISVSLKDQPLGDLASVLALAEREAFLHVTWYRSKRGNQNLKCYILNRRLCPFFNLDVSGFQGRIEVSSHEMGIALTNPTQFAGLVLGRNKREEKDDSAGQLILFDM